MEPLSPLAPIITCVEAHASDPPRLRADAARNRARLIDAARELFAQRGLSVSMDDIARHAGVGVGTAYRRFSSREELIEALFDERMAEVLASVEGALANPDPWAGLVSLLEDQASMQATDRGLRELLFSPAELRERIAPVRARMLPMVEELIERAKATGQLRPDVATTDIPVVNYMLGASADFGGELSPELWRRFLGIVLDGLRARRDGPTPLAPDALEPAQVDEAVAGLHGRR